MPLALLNQFTWQQVELMVCGEADIDVEKLKRIAIYEGWRETENTVKWF